jgi:hypothetical protein
MNGVVESEFNPNSVENPFTFGGAVKIGNNDANVAPEGGSTFVVDPNLSAVTLGKNVIALGTGCFSEAIRDEMGRVIDGPSIEEVNEALRELAQRDGFAMWCPGQLCATTPCSAIINPEGCEEEDDDMYPDKVGRSRVDEKKFKNYNECAKFCFGEYFKMVGSTILDGVIFAAIGGGLIGLSKSLIANFTAKKLAAAIGALALKAGLGQVMGFVGAALVLGTMTFYVCSQFWPCIVYCDKNY